MKQTFTYIELWKNGKWQQFEKLYT